MLAVSTLLILAALGAFSGPESWQPSAMRLTVTAVVGLLSLLFWPGAAGSGGRVALLVIGWTLAAALLAAAVLWVFGQGLQRGSSIATSCAMLLLMLLVAHGLAAALQAPRHGLDSPLPAESSGAGMTVAWWLVLLGSLPLWMGPLAELVSAQHDWAVDAAIGASPLTHLAVASGNDLLRNTWLYQHANLAARPFSYPELPTLVWAYIAAGLGLATYLMAGPGARRRGRARTTHSEMEQVR